MYHLKSDFVVCFVDAGGVARALDAWSDSLDKPTIDAAQNVANVVGSIAGGVTTVSFDRQFATSDASNDVAIPLDADVLVQWATHSAKPTQAGCTDADGWCYSKHLSANVGCVSSFGFASLFSLFSAS